jgi:hypothetical protein
MWLAIYKPKRFSLSWFTNWVRNLCKPIPSFFFLQQNVADWPLLNYLFLHVFRSALFLEWSWWSWHRPVRSSYLLRRTNSFRKLSSDLSTFKNSITVSTASCYLSQIEKDRLLEPKLVQRRVLSPHLWITSKVSWWVYHIHMYLFAIF